MIEVLRFTFESFWQFVGVCGLILWIAMCASLVANSIIIKIKRGDK